MSLRATTALIVLAPALFIISACSDVVDERHATWAEAKTAGALQRGWIPSFVPESAKDLHDVHDLDTNAQTLSFAAPGLALAAMGESLVLLSPEQQTEARSVITWPGSDVAEGVEFYAACDTAAAGYVAVDVKAGRAIYQRSIGSPPGACSRASGS